MSTILTQSQKQTLQGYSRWVKLLTVLGYIYAGFMILIGLATLIAIVGIVPLAFGGLMIWLLTKIRKSATLVATLEADSEAAGETGLAKLVEALENLRVAAKVYAIVMIVGLVLNLLGGLLFGGLIWAAISSGEFNLETEESSSSVQTEQSFEELLQEIDAEIQAAEEETGDQ